MKARRLFYLAMGVLLLLLLSAALTSAKALPADSREALVHPPFPIQPGAGNLAAFLGSQPLITTTPTPTSTPTVCPNLSGTGSGSCNPGYGHSYSYNFDITNDGAEPTLGIVEVHMQVSPQWGDWHTTGPYQYLFQPGINHITGWFYEFGPPPPDLMWRMYLHGVALDGCWTLDVYTPQYPLCGEPTPGITPTSAATITPTRSPTPALPCDVFYLGSTFSCSAPATYDYSFFFHTYDCQESRNITTYFQVGPSDQGPWTDYDQRSEYHIFPTPVAGSFTEPGIPTEYEYAHVVVAGAPPPAYGATTVPMLRCDLGTPGPTFTVTRAPTPPTPHPPDLTGSIGWLPSCDIAHGVLLRTALSGDPNALLAGPSHMRLENRAGDHIDFPVPSLGGPNPLYYDYVCSAGSCTPQSWQDTLPYTLTVDIFNEVAETNEWNNVSVLGGPTPTPLPCIDTPTPGTGTPTVTATPTLCGIEFTDTPPGSTFYSYIHCLACRRIISGYPDGTFRPSNNVTRGQAAKIVSNAAGYSETIPPNQRTFSDVSPDSPFWVFIERVALHGVINGYPDGTFRPVNNMTRGQMAKIAANAKGYNEIIPPAQQTYSDVAPGSTFWVYIERVALHGVVSGYPDGTFRPSNNVTRGQAAKIVANTFFPTCTVRR